jgi:outer membrane protein, heavy metal efflux system
MTRAGAWWWPLGLVLALWLSWPGVALAAPDVGGTLTLPEVLARLPGRHPGWEAADLRIEAARGRQLSARGAFDPRVVLDATLRPMGYYQNRHVDVRVEQPTPLWGVVGFAGWRFGQGSFPAYDGRLETARAGELRAGVKVPLWRDGAIDRRRTLIRQSDRRLDQAERQAEATRLELQLAAARAYWAWVGASQRLRIVEGVLTLAERRQAGLRRMVDSGAVPDIEAVDNERSIADRSLDRVEAQRRLDAAAVSLSLYYRDAEGRPVVPAPSQAPTTLPPPPPAPAQSPDALVADALARRPELLAIDEEQAVAELELRWARNQRAPDVSVQAYVARDFGPGPEYLLPTELALSLSLELPVPLRTARGQLAAAQAELSRVRADRRLLGDEVAAQLRAADIALRAALEQLRLAERQAALAEQVAAAERRRLELGATNILTVNLREQSAAEAATKAIDAAVRSHIAHAEHRVAQGLPPT